MEPRDDIGTEENRWVARPAVGRAIHVLGLVVPVLLAIGTGLATGAIFGRPDSIGMAILRVATTAAVSIVVMASAERVFRRLLPLAAMYQLSLVFPDHAPSRFAMALRSGNSKQIRLRLEQIQRGGVPEPGESSYYETLLELTAALSRHDRLTRGHCERTRAYTEVIIKELDLPREDADRLRWASLLHDIGKLGVDAEILNKPARPSEEEWQQLYKHPELGARLVEPIAAFLGPWVSAVSQHHERWDGGGYPAGLSGRDIHLGGRIVAVADAYDVMTSARSYKQAMSPRDARKELVRCAGSQFDPEIVRAFLATSLGRSRWSIASLGALVHLREVFAILTAAPISAGVVSTVGAVALTTGLVTGAGVVDNLVPPPAGAMTTDGADDAVGGESSDDVTANTDSASEPAAADLDAAESPAGGDRRRTPGGGGPNATGSSRSPKSPDSQSPDSQSPNSQSPPGAHTTTPGTRPDGHTGAPAAPSTTTTTVAAPVTPTTVTTTTSVTTTTARNAGSASDNSSNASTSGGKGSGSPVGGGKPSSG